MENRTDKNLYTIIFAIAMVLVVGVLLAGMFAFTKPLITINEEIEKQQNILYAMGVNANEGTSANFVSTEDAPKLFEQYIKNQLEVQEGKIWGYVALDQNMVVQGAYFDHKGETPGLGANIKQRFFMDDFIGENLLDANGSFKGITVAKGNADPVNKDKTDNEVDAIAGATITGDGVTAMIKKDLKLYLPYFETLKN